MDESKLQKKYNYYEIATNNYKHKNADLNPSHNYLILDVSKWDAITSSDRQKQNNLIPLSPIKRKSLQKLKPQFRYT